MRGLVLAGLLVPALVAGASGQPASSGFRPLVGTLDTVGGTTYDWQVSGPVHRFLFHSPGQGLHVSWLYSAELSNTSFPDRNVRYNFYFLWAHAWNWRNPDYLQSGVNVFPQRAGFGNLDAAPQTGVGVLAAFGGSPYTPWVAHDAVPGAGMFSQVAGPARYTDPVLGIDSAGTTHVVCIDGMSGLTDIRFHGWSGWDTVRVADGGAGTPIHNVAASRYSEKVAVVWVSSVNDREGYCRSSADGGATWGPVDTILPPAAFGGDTGTTFHIASFFPFYDRDDELHLVATVIPRVGDTGHVVPAAIWHWCAANDPQWSELHRAGCAPANLLAPVGYNATFAGRPSLGEDSRGNLYCTWEQFDSANVDPVTGLLRADIFARSSIDNGQTWLPALKLAAGDSASLRFPSVVNLCLPGTPETLAVRYLVDPVAGFFVQNQRPGANCPVVVQKVPVSELGAIADGTTSARGTAVLAVAPSVMRDRLTLSFGRLAAPARVLVGDACGRVTRSIDAAPGTERLAWDGRDDAGRRVAPGVYVIMLEQEGSVAAAKVVRAE